MKMATLMLASCSRFENQYDFVSTASLSNDALAETNYKSTVALDNINQAVKARLRMYDLNSFFEQFPKVQLGTWNPNQETIDLFENLDELTDSKLQDEIYEAIAWINTEVDEPEWKRELTWSREVILSACSASLKEAVIAKETEILDAYPGATGGPVTFIIIMETILSMSSDTFNALYKFIQNLDIKKYNGEDITVVTRELRVNLRRLYACNSKGYVVPPTVCSDLIHIFQTSSCAGFNAVFAQMSVQMLINNNSSKKGIFGTKQAGYKDILRIAEASFVEFKDQWITPANVSGPGQSGFNTGNFSGNKRKCHICGSEDHLMRDCPNRNRNGNGGRGGRGNGNGSASDPLITPPNKEDTKCTKVGVNPNRWDRHFDDGIVRSWCGKCVLRKVKGKTNTKKGRWTDGRAKHYTDEHRGVGNRSGQATQINLANQQQAAVPATVVANNQSSQSSTSASTQSVTGGNPQAASGGMVTLTQALTDLSSD